MKHFSLVVLLLVSLAAFCQSKKEKKAIKTYGVKAVTETVTETVNGKEVTRKDAYTAFDKNANVVLNEEFRKDGTLKHKETAKYDSKGNKLEESVWDAAELQPTPEKYFRYVCKYDSDDNKTEEQSYDASGKLISKSQFSYSTSGKVESVYDPAGKLLKQIVLMYDSKGLKKEKREYDGAKVLLSTRKYQYEF